MPVVLESTSKQRLAKFYNGSVNIHCGEAVGLDYINFKVKSENSL
jgi:hypothetical protein